MSALVESRGTPFAVRTVRFSALVVVTDGHLREPRGPRAPHAGRPRGRRGRQRGRGARPDSAPADPATWSSWRSACPTVPGVALLAELRAAGWQRGIASPPTATPSPSGPRSPPASAASSSPTRPSREPVSRPRGAGSGVEGLSGRELEVLQLVAGGHSNRDIGESLAPVGADREEPPGPHRPQARHRRPRRDGRRSRCAPASSSDLAADRRTAPPRRPRAAADRGRDGGRCHRRLAVVSSEEPRPTTPPRPTPAEPVEEPTATADPAARAT